MARRGITRGMDPEWLKVYNDYAKLGYRVIPVTYNDIKFEGPYKFEFLIPPDQATTDKVQLFNNTRPFCYWAIQIGMYCGTMVIRFTDLDKHEDFIAEHGQFSKTAIIESKVHIDYLYRFWPEDKPSLDEVKQIEFDLLYNDDFIIVPPISKLLLE